MTNQREHTYATEAEMVRHALRNPFVLEAIKLLAGRAQARLHAHITRAIQEAEAEQRSELMSRHGLG